MNLVTTIGFTAAALTTIAFLPQVIKIWKTKQAKDISYSAYFIFGAGVFTWFIYGLLINDWAIIITNSTIFVCILLILGMKFKFESK